MAWGWLLYALTLPVPVGVYVRLHRGRWDAYDSIQVALLIVLVLAGWGGILILTRSALGLPMSVGASVALAVCLGPMIQDERRSHARSATLPDEDRPHAE